MMTLCLPTCIYNVWLPVRCLTTCIMFSYFSANFHSVCSTIRCLSISIYFATRFHVWLSIPLLSGYLSNIKSCYLHIVCLNEVCLPVWYLTSCMMSWGAVPVCRHPSSLYSSSARRYPSSSACRHPWCLLFHSNHRHPYCCTVLPATTHHPSLCFRSACCCYCLCNTYSFAYHYHCRLLHRSVCPHPYCLNKDLPATIISA